MCLDISISKSLTDTVLSLSRRVFLSLSALGSLQCQLLINRQQFSINADVPGSKPRVDAFSFYY